MSLRCGCPDQADDIVFGESHRCTATPKPELDPPRLVPSWVFVVPAERPYETTLSDDCEPGDLG